MSQRQYIVQTLTQDPTIEILQYAIKKVENGGSLVKLLGFVKSAAKMVTGCCKNDKSCYIGIRTKNIFSKI